MDQDRPPLKFDDFLIRMMHALRTRQAGNFDKFRFAGVEENYFDANMHKNQLLFLMHSFGSVAAAHDIFEDEASCALYRDLWDYRLVGHLHKKLPTNNISYRNAFSKSRALPCKPSPFATEVKVKFMNWPLVTKSVPHGDRKLVIDAFTDNCVYTFFLNQYYFSRCGVRVMPEVGDYVIDGGLCFGDTAVRMAADIGPTGRVFGFDPLDLHCKVSRHNAKQNETGSAPIEIFCAGLSDRDAVGKTSDFAGISPGYRLEEGISTRAIDSLVADGSIPHIDFIKLDVEGSELATLQGAVTSLKRFRPKLAVSLYHRPQDLFEIPLYLDALLPDYEFYLDHYTIHGEETVLYARPRP